MDSNYATEKKFVWTNEPWNENINYKIPDKKMTLFWLWRNAIDSYAIYSNQKQAKWKKK